MIVVAGNPTIDVVYTHDGVREKFGGSVYYASLALSAFGAKAKVIGVASADVAAELRQLFRKLGVDVHLIEADVTTTFELDYRKKPRVAKLLKRPSVTIGEVTGDVVILSPVYDELRNASVTARVTVADLQGYLRAGLPTPIVDLVHFSQDDISLTLRELVDFASRWPVAVYTLGEGGAYVVRGRRVFHINSARVDVEDVTGSGDVFIASLTYLHYIEGRELLEAVCEASRYVAGFLASGRVSKYHFECTTRVVLEK